MENFPGIARYRADNFLYYLILNMKIGINQTYVSTYDGKAASMMEKPNIAKFKPDPKLKLMDQVRQVLRYHHYAYRTEQSYCG